MVTEPVQWILLLGAGLAAGVVNAVAGGGSLIVFPSMLAIGLDPLAANVTNAVAQWPGYASMVAGTRRGLRGQRRRLVLSSVATMAGASLGCLLLLVLPGAVFDIVVPALVIASSVLLGVSPWLKRRISVTSADDRVQERMQILLPAIFLAGVYGGYFGGALGVILIATLSLFVHDSLQRLNAMKGVLSVAASTVTVVVFAFYAPVNWSIVAIVAPATLVGGYLGGRIARRLPDGILRWCVIVVGLGVGIYLAVT